MGPSPRWQPFLRLGLLAAAFAPVGFALALWAALPDVEVWNTRNPERTSYMARRAQETVDSSPPSIDRWIPLSRVSPLVVCAVIKAEDRTFFFHRGFEWGALRKATVQRLTGRPGGGGSTITQQLARNLYLSPDQTFSRKLREAAIARKLETTLTKPRILELYLNTVEWGDGIWGIAAASQYYFGEEPDELGAFEASFLAGLLASPRQVLDGQNRVRARGVQRRVLNQLYRAELISGAQLRLARWQQDRFFARLRPGDPVPGALRPVTRRSGVTAPAPGGAPTLDQAVRLGCGLERELQNEYTEHLLRALE